MASSIVRILLSSAAALGALLSVSPARAWTCDSDCNAECGFDLGCRLDCFSTRPSCMPSPVDLSAFDQQARALEDRLVSRFLSHGYAVSLGPDGSPSHVGDSLLWSSIAMGVLPCAVAQPIEDAILASVHAHGGALERIDPLPASYIGNETSRDMETGAFFGFGLRAGRCGDADTERLRQAWALHKAYVEDQNGGRLHAGTNPNFLRTPGMSFLFDLVSSRLGLAPPPDGKAEGLFEAALIGSSLRLPGGACYPVHLVTLQAITAEKLGRPIKRWVYDKICSATSGLGLPLTDWYCRRIAAADWLQSFVPNKWEYRHQRCRTESGDLGPGEESPGVDFLILYHLASGR